VCDLTSVSVVLTQGDASKVRMGPMLQSRGTEHVHTNHGRGQVNTCTYKLVLCVSTVLVMGRIGAKFTYRFTSYFRL